MTSLSATGERSLQQFPWGRWERPTCALINQGWRDREGPLDLSQSQEGAWAVRLAPRISPFLLTNGLYISLKGNGCVCKWENINNLLYIISDRHWQMQEPKVVFTNPSSVIWGYASYTRTIVPVWPRPHKGLISIKRHIYHNFTFVGK